MRTAQAVQGHLPLRLSAASLPSLHAVDPSNFLSFLQVLDTLASGGIFPWNKKILCSGEVLETSDLMSKLASMRLLEQSALASAHQAQVRPFLDVIDALKDLGVDQQLSLPQVSAEARDRRV